MATSRHNSRPYDVIRLLLLFSTSLGLMTPQITDILKRYHCHLLSCNSNIQLWVHFVSTRHFFFTMLFSKNKIKLNEIKHFSPATSARNTNKTNTWQVNNKKSNEHPSFFHYHFPTLFWKKIQKTSKQIANKLLYLWFILLAVGQILFNHSSLVWPVLNTNLHWKERDPLQLQLLWC